MPELPEVETVVRGLKNHIIGRRIASVEIFKPLVVKTPAAAFRAALEGRTIRSIERHGKSIFWTLADDSFVKVHLGMTGAVLVRKKDHKVDPYVRVRFHLDGTGNDVFYRDVRQFGRISLSKIGYEKTWGPDAWNTPENEIFDRLRKKKGMIKNALLNQLVIAGMGNIYVDESLHAAGIHPRKKIEKLSKEKLTAYIKEMKRILALAIKVRGTSFRDYVDSEGKRGDFVGFLKVYGRAGKPCARCKTPIKKTVVASRGTHYCPTCQKG